MVIGLVAAAAIMAPGGQFDLICSGTMDSWGADQVITRKVAISRAQIDLDRKVWCWDSCEQAFVIAGVDDARLVLANERRDDGGHSEITINRITGHYVNSISIRDPMSFDTMTIGKCERADYTIIPQAAF